MHLNHNLRDLSIMAQTYFMTNSSSLTEQIFRDLKPNRSLEKLTIGLGMMKTIKPLLMSLNVFTKLLDLRI